MSVKCPSTQAVAADGFTLIPTRAHSSIPQSIDELAPIGVKSGTCISNRFEALENTAQNDSDGKSIPERREVPISEFIRPSSKRQMRRFKETAKKFAKKHDDCAEGCRCEDEEREEFPGLPEAAV